MTAVLPPSTYDSGRKLTTAVESVSPPPQEQLAFESAWKLMLSCEAWRTTESAVIDEPLSNSTLTWLVTTTYADASESAPSAAACALLRAIASAVSDVLVTDPSAA